MTKKAAKKPAAPAKANDQNDDGANAGAANEPDDAAESKKAARRAKARQTQADIYAAADAIMKAQQSMDAIDGLGEDQGNLGQAIIELRMFDTNIASVRNIVEKITVRPAKAALLQIVQELADTSSQKWDEFTAAIQTPNAAD